MRAHTLKGPRIKWYECVYKGYHKQQRIAHVPPKVDVVVIAGRFQNMEFMWKTVINPFESRDWWLDEAMIVDSENKNTSKISNGIFYL